MWGGQGPSRTVEPREKKTLQGNHFIVILLPHVVNVKCFVTPSKHNQFFFIENTSRRHVSGLLLHLQVVYCCVRYVTAMLSNYPWNDARNIDVLITISTFLVSFQGQFESIAVTYPKQQYTTWRWSNSSETCRREIFSMKKNWLCIDGVK
jgi:hypothetical protein